VFRTVSFLSRELGGRTPSFALTCRNRIPLQRGLGSSASAVVAGVLIADRLLGAHLPPDRLLEIAATPKATPTTPRPLLRGGLVLAYLSPDGWRAETLEPHPDIEPVLLIPEAERIATDEARRVLPRWSRWPMRRSTCPVRPWPWLP